MSGKDLNKLESIVIQKLAKIQEWLTLNQLTLYISKSIFVVYLFKSHKKISKQLNIHFNDQSIQETGKAKFLGIIIDQHLSWKYHIDYVTKNNIGKAIGILCKNSILC